MEAFVVYKIENILDGKSYVGRTNDVKRRLKEHIQRASSSLIHRAIKKHGFDNFSIRILFSTESLEESEEKEVEFIIKENSLYPNGYNLTLKPNPVTYRKPKAKDSKETHKVKLPTSHLNSKKKNQNEFRCSVTFNGKKNEKIFCHSYPRRRSI